MVFLVRKMRMMPRLKQFKIVAVTDRTDLKGNCARRRGCPAKRCDRATTT